MEREQHTMITEGATLTMGEELFKPSEVTQDIVGCCGDLYLESLNTFIFALVFSSEVGVYDGRQGIPGQTPTPVAEGLTQGFEKRLKPFRKHPTIVITVPDTITTRRRDIERHIGTINARFHSWSNVWQHHMVREVWMFSLNEARKKGIHQSEAQLDSALDSDPELENLLCSKYVDAMHAAVRESIGHRTPKAQALVRFIRKNTVAHIGAHLAYDTALNLRTDLGENRSLVPHPTRQTLITSSAQALINFAVPPVIYEIVVVQGAKHSDDLRQSLGNYTERPDIIEIQRVLAEALAGSEEERTALLGELLTTTRAIQTNVSTDSIQSGVRKLAIMRANYLTRETEYGARLREIFPTLKRPAPAQYDQLARVK